MFLTMFQFPKVKMSEMVTCEDVETTTLYPPSNTTNFTYPQVYIHLLKTIIWSN